MYMNKLIVNDTSINIIMIDKHCHNQRDCCTYQREKFNAIKLEPQDQSFEGGGKASMEEEHRAQDAAGAAIS